MVVGVKELSQGLSVLELPRRAGMPCGCPFDAVSQPRQPFQKETRSSQLPLCLTRLRGACPIWYGKVDWDWIIDPKLCNDGKPNNSGPKSCMPADMPSSSKPIVGMQCNAVLIRLHAPHGYLPKTPMLTRGRKNAKNKACLLECPCRRPQEGSR